MNYTADYISSLVENQRKFFDSGKTIDVNWRIDMLKKLKAEVIKKEDQIESALRYDLCKSRTEAYLCDIGPTIMEINEILANIKRWARSELHFSGLLCFPSIFTRVYKVPYGVTLIISPFNFPILLSLGVLAASLSAGNTAIIKPSSKSPESSKILDTIIREIFPPEYVSVVLGGHDVADMCLSERFDKIFYTGSPKVAKHILTEAAKNITPVALELGGETGNWCVIRKDADLKDAARKIAFLKICNSGQICININQVAVAEEVSAEFISLLEQAIVSQIGDDPIHNEEYSKLVNNVAYNKCVDIANKYRERIVYGGYGDSCTNKFCPTIIFPVSAYDDIVSYELFNPFLPIIPFKDDEVQDILNIISSREHPLAFYLFTKDIKWAKRVMKSMQYGGGCINETCNHIMVRGVPFNGVGHSGLGAYHGEWGYREFSHPSTVLFGCDKMNLSLREHPYNGKLGKLKYYLIKAFEK